MKFSSLVISLIIFGMLFSGFMLTFNSIFAKYELEAYSNPTVENVINQTESISSKLESRIQSLQTAQGIQLVVEMFSFVFFGILDTLKLMLSSVWGMMSAFNTFLSETFQVPSWLTGAILTLSVASLAFLIIKAILKWEI
ncbi:MAG TPA: hypothetical protein ENG10_01095 [Candidatus Bathyarchaeota archaeon]|nr:hypothetical protein [Candidatus Bathyarchaeota archaeon]HEX68876.1 hypothetical protein [Candidatus Bathyarchaeota archaeon]